jgi:arylsulfatase
MSVWQIPWIALLLAFTSLFGCSTEKDSRSVLLITIDTLRADHLAGSGYSRPTSPSLDAFAKRGTGFEWAFSTCSYTVPSHASILVGMYPSFHSAGLMNGHQKLKSDETTLAEILRNAGWRTAAIVSNAILNSAIGLDQGFESYNDRLPHRELVRKIRERRASSAVDQTLAKLVEFRDQRFFLWLHLQDPHGAYSPPTTAPPLSRPEDEPPVGPMLPIGEDNSGFRAIPSYQAYGDERAFGDYRDRYAAEIRYLDSELSRLFAYLDAHELLRHTLVVVTADHGEAMGENDFYFAHGHSVGLEQVLVPLFFVGDGVLSDQSVTTPVSNMAHRKNKQRFPHLR